MSTTDFTGGAVPLPPDPLGQLGAGTAADAPLELTGDDTGELEERRRDAYRVG